ncbi:HAMP domain-containing sensor histidine kinase [Spirochaeta isovalerica]|uniref:histidine kinase n=1 Tax=Spirochaeta isovalerica TaxID=150 RepID=A0A841RDJ6_9SPIO|nr:HAMP domain-containing sensor histidine kinase [Spirochaeta isovalerica]MBB6482115.1 two-component system phosphate regulon sensor histidine kinase PhoR [Spirochaeta isovalerica]
MKRGFYPVLLTLNILTLLICGLILFLFSLNLLVKQTEKRGFDDIEQIRRELKHSSFQVVAAEQAEIISARVVIVDMDSNLLADSNLGSELIPGKFINASLMEAKNSGFAESILRGVRSGILTISTAGKVELNGEDILISLTYNVDEERKLIIFYGGMISLIILLVILLSGTAGAYLLSRYKKPLRTLLHHTREAAKGGFNKISINSTDGELNQLAEEFNALVDRYNFLVEADNSKYSRINTLLSNLHTGILMVDNNLEVTLVNPEAEKLLNLNKLSLFHIRGQREKDCEALSEILDKIDESSDRREGYNFTIKQKSGVELDIDVEIVTSKYEPYTRSGYLIILRDVTEMRRLERLKDEFVANVSHELRTPLTVISGFVETLKSYDTLQQEDRSLALDIIEVETERLKKLISELLLLSKIEGEMGHVTKSLIDPVLALEQVERTLAPMAGKKCIHTEIEIGKKVMPLFGVPGWFRQIVYNLYENAIKYTPEQGRVCLKLFQIPGALCLEVEDSGCGIPDTDRERIFDRFYRGDNTMGKGFSGNGIGLTITRHMVNEFEGEISVEKSVSGGALFRVILPIREKRENRK